jgi:hypothetical protein
VRVTPAGKAVLQRLAPLAASVRADASAGIAAADWAALQELLKAIRANLAALRACGDREVA